MLKNRYEINGAVTTIFIERRNGDVYNVLIDTEDLPKLLSDGGSWCVDLPYECKELARKPYAIRNASTTNGKRKFVKLHRELVNAPDEYLVDHINGNTLDNRKSNLRVTDQIVNQLNRKSANRNSKTGVKGVHFDNTREKWIGAIQINGKARRKRFSNFDDALDYVTKLREEADIC